MVTYPHHGFACPAEEATGKPCPTHSPTQEGSLTMRAELDALRRTVRATSAAMRMRQFPEHSRVADILDLALQAVDHAITTYRDECADRAEDRMRP